MLARDKDAIIVSDDHRSFDFPVVELPKKRNPNPKGIGFRGGRSPDPVRPVTVALIHSSTRTLPRSHFGVYVSRILGETLIDAIETREPRKGNSIGGAVDMLCPHAETACTPM